MKKMLVALLLLTGCGKETNHLLSPVNDFCRGADSTKGLWISHTDFQSPGTLTRLDLGTCEITQMARTEASVTISADTQGVFLLSQRKNDALHRFNLNTQLFDVVITLPENTNPQMATRDSRDRIWLTSLNSNEVEVYDGEGKSRIRAIDLSDLGESDDGFAELSRVSRVTVENEPYLAVLAARLHRNTSSWVPDGVSAVTLIRESDLVALPTVWLEVANPIHVFQNEDDIHVIGAGDLSPGASLKGGEGVINAKDGAQVSEDEYDTQVLAADSYLGKPLLLTRNAEQTCLTLNAESLHCEKGSYAFSKVVVSGEVAFLEYSANGNSELWRIHLETKDIAKHPLFLPAGSMVVSK